MRKSGWAAAAGVVSAGLLLTACGGGSSNTGAQGGTTPTAGSASTSTPNSGATTAPPQAKPSSGGISSPPPGAIYFIVQKYGSGYLMAEADGDVVYTYAGDSAGKASTCTGSCAAEWKPVKGVGLVSPADDYQNKFSVIDGQVAYNGLPLYTKAGAGPIVDHAGGQWKTITMQLSEVMG
jgi:predicted lipoprotein with Yx(FWY)xxD motif